MKQHLTRRELLAGAGIGAGALLVGPARSLAASAPTGRVAVARCKTYGPELVPAMEKMFDQIGGLSGLVKGKTVAVKINLIGVRWQRLGNAPMEETFWTHPRAIGAAVHLMGKAGAKKIRVVEGPWSTPETLEEVMLSMNWKPQDILNAAPNVEFENTNYLGRGKKYSRFMVPSGAMIYPGYDLNHSYEDCDVFVSFAKLKEHAATGVTLSMKNVYGTTPVTIYGEGAGVDEPSVRPHGGRGGTFHFARRLPSKSAPQQIDMSLPKDAGYRLPRIIAELNSARPVHLAIIDGVKAATGAETNYGSRPQAAVNPGVLIAGTNAVATDAVAMAVMGFDPMAVRGKAPFANSDSMLQLGENLGVGLRDPSKNDIAGVPISEVVFDYTAVRDKILADRKKA
ncbi:MAG TPA: DUF362 domain-containing protein [Bryobacteraceae bacterium]|nr:DUF362 domain-containing protein [Bryobacteraceae bacterium]